MHERDSTGSAGDLNVHTIFSQSGTVHLEADGSIVDGLNHDFVNIQPNAIVLLADAVSERRPTCSTST